MNVHDNFFFFQRSCWSISVWYSYLFSINKIHIFIILQYIIVLENLLLCGIIKLSKIGITLDLKLELAHKAFIKTTLIRNQILICYTFKKLDLIIMNVLTIYNILIIFSIWYSELVWVCLLRVIYAALWPDTLINPCLQTLKEWPIFTAYSDWWAESWLSDELLGLLPKWDTCTCCYCRRMARVH